MNNHDQYELKCQVISCLNTRKVDYRNFRDAKKCKYCHEWKLMSCSDTDHRNICVVFACQNASDDNIHNHLVHKKMKCYICDIFCYTPHKICCWHEINDYLKLPFQKLFKKCFICSWVLCSYHYLKCRLCLKTFCSDHMNINDHENKDYCDVCCSNYIPKYVPLFNYEDNYLNIIIFDYINHQQ
jgi:hypothetical protein